MDKLPLCLAKTTVLVATSVLLVGSFAARAQTEITTTSIHIDHSSVPATDLVDAQGSPLPVETLESMRTHGKDISQLDPAESQLWTHQSAPSETLDVSENSVVRFDSVSMSRLGNFRFNGFVQTSSGEQAFQFNLSRTVHDILLRDALLRRLGYRLDPIKYLKKVRVDFASPLEAEDFVLQLRTKTAGAKERFIVGGSEKAGYFILQDVVVVPAQFQNYSLAYGTIPASIISGRRILNSLIVPLSLVEMPESVNLFGWEDGSVFNNSVQLESESGDGMGHSTFSTSYEDAQWAVRRLARLTRKDFTAIVKFARLPKPVALLVTEKLIARRNSLVKLFHVKASQLSIRPNVSYGSTLKDGKITKVYASHWPGYAARFAFGDPESPLSSSQRLLLARTELNSAVIQNLVNQFNTRLLKGTDVNKKLTAKIVDRINKDIRSLLTTGHMQSSTYAVDGVPYGKANFILSRDIVTGSYLGADNVISTADSIGLNLTLGEYLAISGLPSNVTGSINASASITRVYSHLTPVHSLKAALKQPFKNMIVPAAQSQVASVLTALDGLTLRDLSTDEGKQKFDDAISKLKDRLGVGESFIITDSVGPSISFSLGYGQKTPIGLDLAAYGTFTAKQYVLARTYILRSDENTIQVYRNVGNAIDFGLSFSTQLQASVLTLGIDRLHGGTKTKYFSVPLTTSDDNPNSLAQIQALVQTIRSGSLENLEDLQDPYLLDGKINATTANASFLFTRWKWQDRDDLIGIEAPTGQRRVYQNLVTGHRSGYNYEDFALDVATSLIKSGLGQDVELTRVGSTDPADSIGGSSYSRILNYEAQLNSFKGPNSGFPDDEVLKINYRWRGWSADHAQLQHIVNIINSKAGGALFSRLRLKDTKKLRLYNIQLSIVVYEGGLKRLYQNIGAVEKALQGRTSSQGQLNYVIGHIKQLKSQRQNGKFEDYSKNAVECVSFLEQYMPIPYLIRLLGSKNVFVYTSLTGFREGDEAGDQPMVSNTLGQIGSRHSLGPISALKSKIGITDSELFGNWFLEPL